jgi:peptidoglycan/LPS O-acetylase OafA/YrhL
MSSTPTRPTEIRALAGARALPPLLLVLYHYHEGHGYQHFRWFDVFVAKGYLWVEFFFALSAFVLIHTYGGRAKEFWHRRTHLEFLKARLSRLYPLHLATLLIMLVMIIGLRALASAGGYVSIYDVPGYHPYADLPSFIGNLFLVQAWHLFPSLTWNGVAWFVSVLFFLMLIFPLFVWISERGVLWAPVLIAGGFTILYALTSTVGHGLDITYDFGLIRGFADFSIGVGLAMLYRAAKQRGVDGVSELWITLFQFAVVAAFLYAVYHTGWSHTPRDLWLVPPMMALIFCFALDRGLVAKLFQTKVLHRLGEWSFAIYMGQTTWLQLLRYAEQRIYPNPPPAWVPAIHILEPMALVVLCTAWGWVLYTTIEQPASRWLRPSRNVHA